METNREIHRTSEETICRDAGRIQGRIKAEEISETKRTESGKTRCQVETVVVGAAAEGGNVKAGMNREEGVSHRDVYWSILVVWHNIAEKDSV